MAPERKHTNAGSSSDEPQSANGSLELAHSSHFRSPGISSLSGMNAWVAKLNSAIRRNQIDDDLIEQMFGQKIEAPKVYQHPSFWARLIGSVLTQVGDRPEATFGWVHYSLVLLLNSVDSSDFKLAESEKLQELLAPYLVIDQLFEKDHSAIEDQGQYRFISGRSPRHPWIAINHQSAEMCRIDKAVLPLIDRNTCLLLAVIFSLYDVDQVDDVRQLLQNGIADFLTNVIRDALTVPINQLFEAKKTRQIRQAKSSCEQKSLSTESVSRLQSAIFSMIAIQKCIRDFPGENFFRHTFNEIIPELELLADHEMTLGKCGQSDLSKNMVYAIQLKILAYSTLNLLKFRSESCFVSAPSNVQPISSGYWMLGNHDVSHHGYQLDITQLQSSQKYYCELLVLTCGQLLAGISPAFAREENQDQARSANWVAEIPNSVFLDVYSRTMWVNGTPFKSKSRQSDLPPNREGIVLGILLDTSKTTARETIQFYLDGQRVTQKVDQINVGNEESVPWVGNRLPANTYCLTFALTAYQQGVAVFQRDNWTFAANATTQIADLNEFPVSIRPNQHRQEEQHDAPVNCARVGLKVKKQRVMNEVPESVDNSGPSASTSRTTKKSKLPDIRRSARLREPFRERFSPTEMPVEILSMILISLGSLSDIIRVRRVCRYWNSLVKAIVSWNRSIRLNLIPGTTTTLSKTSYRSLYYEQQTNNPLPAGQKPIILRDQHFMSEKIIKSLGHLLSQTTHLVVYFDFPDTDIYLTNFILLLRQMNNLSSFSLIMSTEVHNRNWLHRLNAELTPLRLRRHHRMHRLDYYVSNFWHYSSVVELRQTDRRNTDERRYVYESLSIPCELTAIDQFVQSIVGVSYRADEVKRLQLTRISDRVPVATHMRHFSQVHDLQLCCIVPSREIIFDSEWIKTLRPLKNLTSLKLTDFGIDVANTLFYACLPNVKHLSMFGYDLITRFKRANNTTDFNGQLFCKQLGRKFPNLESLELMAYEPRDSVRHAKEQITAHSNTYFTKLKTLKLMLRAPDMENARPQPIAEVAP